MLLAHGAIAGIQSTNPRSDEFELVVRPRAREKISPGLVFLRRVPEENGAQLFKVGTSEDSARDALLRSPERKRLHEAGKYRPTVYLLAWARHDMLAWARQYVGRYGGTSPSFVCQGIECSLQRSGRLECRVSEQRLRERHAQALFQVEEQVERRGGIEPR